MGRRTDPRVAVVLLNWNGWQDTVACLDSLMGLDCRPVTIWVFDNGSTDESVSRLSAWGRRTRDIGTAHQDAAPFFLEIAPDPSTGAPDANVVLFRNEENLGFAGGVNRACEIADRSDVEFLWLLNNDSLVERGTLAALVDCARSAPGSPVGSLVRHGGEGDVDRIAFARGQLPHDLLFRSPVRAKTAENAQCWRSDWATFASVLMPMDLIRQRLHKDGFVLDPRLFMYAEDVEFGLYCRSIGRRLLISRDGSVVHRESASSGGRGNPRSFYYITRNRLLVARSWLRQPLLSMFIVAYIFSRLVLIANHLLRKRTSVTRSVAMGLIDGLRGRHGQWERH